MSGHGNGNSKIKVFLALYHLILCNAPITTSRRFKCVPQILGSLSIHIFKLLFFLITHSCRAFADHAAHFAERKFFDVGEKYFFCFQPVLGIKPPRQIYCAA